MGILVVAGGLLTTVQDAGRVGFQQFGVPVSGVVDRKSFHIANHLVGNDEDEAVLEVTLLGPCLEFTKTNVIAITGGNLPPLLDGRPVAMYRALQVENGSVLSFAAPKTGCRSYIAFAGGLDIEPVMGSRSTYVKAKLGGFQGRKLEQGDRIAFRASVSELAKLEYRAVEPEDFTGSECSVRVVLGPQDDAFTPKGLEIFLNSVYTVTNEFDRMGCRLEGESIEHVKDGNIISDGISFGAVQVPAQGRPILMLADRQTTGGYTKIANVITVDFSKIAQLKAGDRIRFEAIDIVAAQELYLAEIDALRAMRRRLDAPCLQAPAAPPLPEKHYAIRVNGTVYRASVRELP